MAVYLDDGAINESLKLHKAPRLETLDIALGPYCPTDANVVNWLENAVERRVFVDVHSPVCLPSLKDEDSLVGLLSSCPILNYLHVERHDPDNVTKFSVKVPSLVTLTYLNQTELGEEDVEDIGGSLVIDSAILKKFANIDCSTNSCSIENKPHLDNAVIYVNSNLDDKFIRCLSSIRLFEISLSVCNDFPLSFKQPNDVPICLSTKLEIFGWKKYGGTREEKQVLRYILANSKCLKRVGISLKPRWMWNEKKIMKELKSMYRVSTTSQLLFSTQLEFVADVENN
ncbi:PREDICTED: putative F-box/FBD/LRR-repeat protein At1g22000 [Camelina sativa]|uniref:F-box/FBD/LRR-repeat protein At1g22000 n=1 Tax=Camelina sativa TaxID=90675 RepID=A0ABM1QL83_CAMSA|nr:PREDICTED: putative F-box/FBD/LRR-repeat protein At1g22000 [Camelina sativa]